MKTRRGYITRQVLTWLISLALLAGAGYLATRLSEPTTADTTTVTSQSTDSSLAINGLAKLAVKERETGDDYERSLFSSGWASWRDCNVRQKILNRDIQDIKLDANGCTVIGGTLNDPYSGKTITLSTKSAVSKKVQIDHIVALSNAWQTGARYLSKEERKELANDDLELIAVSSSANQDKSDGAADEWLPDNKAFHCPYVARQIAVKLKYHLWVTESEKSAMSRVLSTCPNEPLPVE